MLEKTWADEGSFREALSTGRMLKEAVRINSEGRVRAAASGARRHLALTARSAADACVTRICFAATWQPGPAHTLRPVSVSCGVPRMPARPRCRVYCSGTFSGVNSLMTGTGGSAAPTPVVAPHRPEMSPRATTDSLATGALGGTRPPLAGGEHPTVRCYFASARARRYPRCD